MNFNRKHTPAFITITLWLCVAWETLEQTLNAIFSASSVLLVMIGRGKKEKDFCLLTR